MVRLRRMSDEPVCPDCGHAVAVHPTDGRNLSICAACIWEEDDRKRAEKDMCERHYPDPS
jgi:hypothetical protein